METKGSILRFCLALALRGVRLQYGKRFMRLGLTEEQRYEAAARTVEELRKHGGWKDLDDPVTPVHQWDRDRQKGR